MPAFAAYDFLLLDSTDFTKALVYNLSNLTTDFTHTITIPSGTAYMVCAGGEGSNRQLCISTGGAGSSAAWRNPDFDDDIFYISNSVSSAKKLKFDCSGVTSPATRTWTVRDLSGGVVVDAGTVLAVGRIPIVTTGGALTDDADLTFDTQTLTVTKLAVGTTTAVTGLPRSLFDNYADVSVGGAETDIYSVTTAASTFDANGAKVLANYGGNFVTIGTESVQLQVKFAGTTIWDSTGIAVSTGTSSWRVYAELIRVSATVVRYSVSLNTTGASGFVYCSVGELTGLTLSNTNILKITGTSSGVGSGVGDIVGKMSSVRYQPAA